MQAHSKNKFRISFMRKLTVGLVGIALLVIGCGNGQQESPGDQQEEAKTVAEKETQQMSPDDSVSADWQIRLDYPDRGSEDDITIEQTSKGYHIVSGPRAIYYKKGMTAMVPYHFEATFTQNNQPGPEAYGLFVGGEKLESDDQGYLYFLIRETGEYLIKRRVGSETETVVGWTAYDDIQSVKEQEKPVNTLAVEAASDSLHFMINGEQVTKIPQEQIQYTEGQTGLRINHRLDLTVEDIKLEYR